MEEGKKVISTEKSHSKQQLGSCRQCYDTVDVEVASMKEEWRKIWVMQRLFI
jgi:hypothetical protein